MSPSQLAFADTALISTVEDLAKWEAALCKKSGQPGGVLEERWLAEMWTPRFVKGNRPTHYGYGWYVDDYADGVVLIGHSGLIQGFSSDFSRFKSKSSVITVIVLTNRELPEGAAFSLRNRFACEQGGSETGAESAGFASRPEAIAACAVSAGRVHRERARVAKSGAAVRRH